MTGRQAAAVFIPAPRGVPSAAVVRTSRPATVANVTTTRYLEIADALAAEIAALPPGSRLDSEHQITHRFGVGRAAARAALQELERRLLVRRVQGAGTFVNRRIDYTISHRRPPSFHRTVAAAGARPRSVIRGIARQELCAERAELLDRAPGTPAHRLVRESYVDDLLSSLSHEWVPVDVVHDLDPGLRAAESLDEVLRQMGRVHPVRAWCRVSLDVPAPEVLAHLQLDASHPVWLTESLSRDEVSGRPLMCSQTWMRPDVVRVVVELGSPEEGSGR